MHLKKKESPMAAAYDIESAYLVCIHLGHESAILENMQFHLCLILPRYRLLLHYSHPSAYLKGTFPSIPEYIGCYTPDRIVTRKWTIVSNRDIQKSNFFAQHGVSKIRTIGFRPEYIETTWMKSISCCFVWHPLFYCQNKLSLHSSSIIICFVSFRWAVNIRYC